MAINNREDRFSKLLTTRKVNGEEVTCLAPNASYIILEPLKNRISELLGTIGNRKYVYELLLSNGDIPKQLSYQNFAAWIAEKLKNTGNSLDKTLLSEVDEFLTAKLNQSGGALRLRSHYFFKKVEEKIDCILAIFGNKRLTFEFLLTKELIPNKLTYGQFAYFLRKKEINTSFNISVKEPTSININQAQTTVATVNHVVTPTIQTRTTATVAKAPTTVMPKADTEQVKTSYIPTNVGDYPIVKAQKVSDDKELQDIDINAIYDGQEFEVRWTQEQYPFMLCPNRLFVLMPENPLYPKFYPKYFKDQFGKPIPWEYAFRRKPILISDEGEIYDIKYQYPLILNYQPTHRQATFTSCDRELKYRTGYLELLRDRFKNSLSHKPLRGRNILINDIS